MVLALLGILRESVASLRVDVICEGLIFMAVVDRRFRFVLVHRQKIVAKGCDQELHTNLITKAKKKEEVKYIDEKEDINTREKWLYLLQNMEKRECVVCIDYTF